MPMLINRDPNLLAMQNRLNHPGKKEPQGMPGIRNLVRPLDHTQEETAFRIRRRVPGMNPDSIKVRDIIKSRSRAGKSR
jgi:HSP20 family molecular chaperone IbpA